jgi:hypothetical protein
MGSSHSAQRLKAGDGQVPKSSAQGLKAGDGQVPKSGDLRLKSRPWLSKEYAVKKGCDSLTGNVYASPFVTTNAETDPRTPPSALVSHASRFKTISDASQHLDVNASLSVHNDVTGVRASAAASFIDDMMRSEKQVSLYAVIRKDYETEYLVDAEQLWKKSLGINPAKMMEEEFTERYGDAFICGGTKSVVLIAKMCFTYGSEEQKIDAETSVDAAASLWSTNTEASGGIKAALRDVASRYDATFDLSMTGINDDQPLSTNLEEMMEAIAHFNRNVDYRHAVHYRANIMPYAALPGYGGFKASKSSPSGLSRDAREQAISEMAEDYYSLVKPLRYLDDVFRNAERFRPAGESDWDKTGRQMAEYLEEKWKSRLDNLKSEVNKVHELFEAGSEVKECFKLKQLSELDIYPDELPVKAGALPVLPLKTQSGSFVSEKVVDNVVIQCQGMPWVPIVTVQIPHIGHGHVSVQVVSASRDEVRFLAFNKTRQPVSITYELRSGGDSYEMGHDMCLMPVVATVPA